MKDSYRYTMPTDLRQTVWVLWHRTDALISKHFGVQLVRNTGVSSQQFMVLLAMAQEGGQSTATALAEQLTRNPNTLSTILDRMERGGLVKKERDTVDRRLVRVTMTPEGKKKLAECVQVGWKVIEKLTARFSDDELKDAVRLITKLKDAAAEELAADKSAPDPEAEPVEA